MNTIAEVELVMHRDVVTVSPMFSVGDAARALIKHHIGCLPVVDAQDRVVGILTERDLFTALLNLLGDTGSTLQSREAGRGD